MQWVARCRCGCGCTHLHPAQRWVDLVRDILNDEPDIADKVHRLCFL